ncbi:MAG: TatD family hydrolase [Oscillospiraceae bacterium]|nr:TatD family hydrolase [Oscillospiraceae bacterium]
MTKIFDSHAHYTSKQFDDTRYTLLDELFSTSVGAIIDCGIDLKSTLASLQLAERYPNFYTAAGIHPESVCDVDETELKKIIELLRHPKVVAIGEIGLDYYWDMPKDLQLRYFEAQLNLAEKSGLPVIVHDREAHADTLALLQKYKPHGVVHCYSGSAESAHELVKLGMYIGFTGVITFKNARKALEAIEVIPLDRLLLETDCPYMAPVPLRGQCSHSGMIAYTAEKMAEIKGVSTQEILQITFENTCRLFQVSPIL